MDALVSDDPLDSSFFRLGFGSGSAGRRTPAPPPGLGMSPTVTSRQPAVAVPAVPLSPARIQTPAGSKSHTLAGVVGAATPEQTPGKKAPGTDAKKNIKAFAVESGLAKDIATGSPALKSKKVLQEEDFPALDASRGVSRTATPVLSVAATPKASPVVRKSRVDSPAPTAAPESDRTGSVPAGKKPAVVTLNTAAATKSSAQAKSSSNTPVVSAIEKADSAAFPALPTPSAASAANVASPSVKAAPKTLRVVNTPKAENPPALAGSHIINKPVSSISRPATPGSHDVSDSASVVSTAVSASRTSSPPPTRIGSAPVRVTTKSQQRKARKDMTKEQSAALAEAKSPEPEEHAPIFGRQKKKKKEKPSSAKATEKRAPKKVEIAETGKVEDASASSSTEELSGQAKKTGKGAKETKVARSPSPVLDQNKTVATPEPSSPHETTSIGMPDPAEEQTQDPAENPKTMPDVVFQDLVRNRITAGPEHLALFKTLGDSSARGERNTAAAETTSPPPSTKNIVTEQDHATLLAGQPLHKIVDGHRILITPNGDCLRNLTEVEEETYLFYQKRVALAADRPDTFVAPRHQPRAGGFSLVKGRAVPNGPPSFFPPHPSASQRLFSDDPVNKLQREEAISYINQFVLPRLNLGTANLGFPGSWKSNAAAGSAAAAGNKDASGAPTHRDVAAASLNSLAPWIYGHDAAAGAGIYSAESGGSGLKDIPEDETPFGGLEAPQHPHDGISQGQGHGQVPNQQAPGGKLPPLNGISLMSVEDAESALQLARKETEKLEKGLNQVIKRNRRLLLAPGGR